jgi:transaldolase/glucose-6-phosphate isomerase
MNRMEFQFGALADRLNGAIGEAQEAGVAKRIWRKDASLWKTDDAGQEIIRNSLGWLTVPDEMIGVVDELVEFADLMRRRGFQHVMVCGMGGSSLCPEVLARTFGRQSGFPELLVLDSTDPDVLAQFLERIDIEHCLFIIASKSGSTTEPTVFYKFWYDQLSKRRENPGENFIAITDPGSPLVDTASELGFQRTFLNQADIGGRYSALSYFGMVPAALMGIDVRKFLERAKQAAQSCSAVMPAAENPGLQLGAVLGECANAGRDKLTLLLDPQIATLGLWIEQLVAESTGKEGKGILPVNGEPPGEPSVYGNDRVFISISLSETQHRVADAPHLYRELTDIYDLAAEFFVWEFATACAGWKLGINPFDQPNVQEAKDATRELLNEFSSTGSLPDQQKLIADDDAVRRHVQTIKPGDYIAFLNFIEETPEVERKLQEIRIALRDATKCATTTGYGPRFLHSTGQLHKGGPNTGVFFQITAEDKVDFDVPGEPYTFSILKQAQALGDFRALSTRGRRVLRIDFGSDTMAGLDHLHQVILNALNSYNSASAAHKSHTALEAPS